MEFSEFQKTYQRLESLSDTHKSLCIKLKKYAEQDLAKAKKLLPEDVLAKSGLNSVDDVTQLESDEFLYFVYYFGRSSVFKQSLSFNILENAMIFRCTFDNLYYFRALSLLYLMVLFQSFSDKENIFVFQPEFLTVHDKLMFSHFIEIIILPLFSNNITGYSLNIRKEKSDDFLAGKTQVFKKSVMS